MRRTPLSVHFKLGCAGCGFASRKEGPRAGPAHCGQGRPTFRVLPGSGAPGPEGLPCAAALPEAPALGHLARTVLQALVGAGRPPDGLGLRGPLALGSHASGAGEDTVFQTDLLTAPARTDRRTDDRHRKTAREVTLQRTLAPAVGRRRHHPRGGTAVAVGWSMGVGGRVARVSGDRRWAASPAVSPRGLLGARYGRGGVSGTLHHCGRHQKGPEPLRTVQPGLPHQVPWAAPAPPWHLLRALGHSPKGHSPRPGQKVRPAAEPQAPLPNRGQPRGCKFR